MDIREHVVDGETRLHVIVGDPIAQVKSPSALTPMLLARGHNSVVMPVHIVNATPLGMREEDPLPFQASSLRKQMFVACVITAPALSPVVRAARAAGCATSTGGQMHASQQQMLVDFMLGS